MNDCFLTRTCDRSCRASLSEPAAAGRQSMGDERGPVAKAALTAYCP